MNSHQPHAARGAWERREVKGKKLTDGREEIEQVAAEELKQFNVYCVPGSVQNLLVFLDRTQDEDGEEG